MFLERVDRPDVDRIEHIRPAIALEQKNPVRTARSTVGTATEVLRLPAPALRQDRPRPLPALRRGRPAPHSPDSVADALLARARRRARAGLLPPAGAPPASRRPSCGPRLVRRGFARVKVGDDVRAIWPPPPARDLAGRRGTIAVVLDRARARPRAPQPPGRVPRERACARAAAGRRSSCVGRRPAESAPASSSAASACGTALERPQPLLFSFNHPLGACPECKGFGNILRYDEALVVPDRTLSLAGGAVEPWTHPSGEWYQKRAAQGGQARGRRRPTGRTRSSPRGARRWVYEGDGEFPGIQRLLRGGRGVPLQAPRARLPLPLPQPVALPASARARGSSRRRSPCAWADCTHRRVRRPDHRGARGCLAATASSPRGRPRSRATILRPARGQAQRSSCAWASATSRSARQTRTLSGGEAQRINLANQLGAQLVGTLYVLDEPSIGLHARDTTRLAELCRELAAGRQHGRRRRARPHASSRRPTTCVELGPGSGERGGEIVFAGPQAEFRRDTRSLTARYLSRPREHSRCRSRGARAGGSSPLVGAREHNLKDVTRAHPAAARSPCVTGVSGSGKSTLVHDTLYRAVARAFKTDFEAPGAHDALTGSGVPQGRAAHRPGADRPHAALEPGHLHQGVRRDPQALRRACRGPRRSGSAPGAFSFNVPGGRCETCEGDGFQKLEMYFFEDVYVTCQECEGRRYRPEVLQVDVPGARHQRRAPDDGRRGGGLLRRPAEPGAAAAQVLQEVGLGYLRLGQPATTLSGGEAQRLKIAAELGARAEPATSSTSSTSPPPGLHLDDVRSSSGCSTAWWTRATPCSSSSTTST